MTRASTFFVTILFASSLAGCASGPGPLLRGGWFPSSYKPPVGHNRFTDKDFAVTIDRIQNGGMGTHFFAAITVRNIGSDNALFDPGEIELLVPETGMTYHNITKDKREVTVPLGFDLMTPTHIKPGQKITGSLWFQTPPYKASAKAVEISYRDSKLDFPPAMPTATKSKEKDAED